MAQADRHRRRRFRASRRLSIVGIGLLIVIILGAGLAVWDRREEAIAHSRQEMSNLGVVLAEQTARSLQAVDLVLQEMRTMVLAAGDDSPEAFERTMATEDVHRFLADRLKLIPQANAVELVSADGRLVNSSRVWPAPVADLSDRDYYVQLRQRDGPGLYISAPVISPSHGRLVVFSRSSRRRP